MKLRNHIRASAVGLGFTIALAGPVRAQIVFDNFGPGNSTGVGEYSLTAGFMSAMGFTPSANVFLAEIDIALFHLSTLGPNAALLELRADASNSPGAILESWTVTGLFEPPFGNLTTTDPRELVLSALHPFLTAGTQYWLDAGVSDPSTRDGWEVSDVGLLPYANSTDNGATWSILGPQDAGAFRVIGTPATSSTPEPASLVLLATGLIGLRVARWKRRPVSR